CNRMQGFGMGMSRDGDVTWRSFNTAVFNSDFEITRLTSPGTEKCNVPLNQYNNHRWFRNIQRAIELAH
ncbi:MAG: hypothetical protein ACOC7K_01130, partial [bacterium]